MKVINRSDSTVTYELPELSVRRTFSPGEEKDITGKELETLYQQTGGYPLIKDFLLVGDRDWVLRHYPDAPIEYFWNFDDIRKCILEDSPELFSETLDYAPEGVVDVIKRLAWQLPMTDLNKVEALREKTGFDAQAATQLMSNVTVTNKDTTSRLRKG